MTQLRPTPTPATGAATMPDNPTAGGHSHALVCPRCGHGQISVCPASTHRWLCRTCWHPFHDSHIGVDQADARALRQVVDILDHRPDTAAQLTRLLAGAAGPQVGAALRSVAHSVHPDANPAPHGGGLAADQSEAA